MSTIHPRRDDAHAYGGLILTTILAALLHAAFILGVPGQLIADLGVEPIRRALRIDLVAAQGDGGAAPPVPQTEPADIPEPPAPPPPPRPAPVKPEPAKPVPEEPETPASRPTASTEITRTQTPPAVETAPAELAKPVPEAPRKPASRPAAPTEVAQTQAPPAVETAPVQPPKPKDTPPAPAPSPLADPLAFEPLTEVRPDSAPSSAAELITRGLAMARSGEGLTGTSTASQRPGLRRKHITTRTRDPKYAAYMDSWVKKVERIGAMNYAERGGKARLTGTLRLDVAINPDGTVAAIDLLRSSGNKEIDEAARRIVRLGEPYAPLPPEIRAEADILHITRPWRFSDGNLWGGE